LRRVQSSQPIGRITETKIEVHTLLTFGSAYIWFCLHLALLKLSSVETMVKTSISAVGRGTLPIARTKESEITCLLAFGQLISLISHLKSIQLVQI
jgi:hypothetical protein